MMMMTMMGLSLTNSLFLWIPGKDRYRKEVGRHVFAYTLLFNLVTKILDIILTYM